MLVSASRKVQNDIQTLTHSSDRFIEPSHHYIVSLEYENSKVDATQVAKLLATGADQAKPLAVYVFRNTLHLLFSSVEPDANEKHQYDGSHHAICSVYTSIAALEKKCKVMCSIIEFESRTKVVVYFQSKVQDSINFCLTEQSGGYLTKKTVTQHTMTECIDILKKKASVEWNKLPSHSKFGTAYKCVGTEDGGTKFSTLSEQINLQNIDRYISYFFE